MIPDKTSPSSSEIIGFRADNIDETAEIANRMINEWQVCNPDKDVVSSSLTSPTHIKDHGLDYYVAFLAINWVRKA